MEERLSSAPWEAAEEGGPREPVRRHRYLGVAGEEAQARDSEAQGRAGQ